MFKRLLVVLAAATGLSLGANLAVESGCDTILLSRQLSQRAMGKTVVEQHPSPPIEHTILVAQAEGELSAVFAGDEEEDSESEDVVPEFTFSKERYELGEPIVAIPDFTTAGIAIEWEADISHLPAPGPDQSEHFWVAKEGTYPVRMNWGIPNGDQRPRLGKDIKLLVVGQPEPAKTLAELAEGKAKDIVFKCQSLIELANIFESPLDVWETWDGHWGELADNKAVNEIERRLEKAIGDSDEAFTSDQTAGYQLTLTTAVKELGAPIPPGPGPGPDPDPVPTPDDPWGVAAAVTPIVASLSAQVKAQAPATAAIFEQAAKNLEDGTFVSMNEATSWVVEERTKLWGSTASEWSAMTNRINEIFKQHWPMLKGDLINFYRCVAAGLRAVQ